ncbi:MAG: CoA activase [Chloroflexi bacterium]|nr:CoA activase [Chloroflexota bacterium]
MATAGIDIGAKTIKVVVLEDGKLIGKSLVQGGLDQKASAEQALTDALAEAGIARDRVSRIVATGAGRKYAPFADDDVTEVGADARGIVYLMPSVRTVIDVGAEEGRGVRVDTRGKVVDFVVNEKCAAGAGTFTEAMARALEVKLEELAQIALQSTNSVPMNAQCAVFAESEVVSLVHSNTSKQDIARAIHDAIASRIISMVRRVGVENDVAVIGGMARNPAFVAAMERGLESKVLVPEDCEYISALGAAVVAAS